jgi:ADP-heptose:LPS heptosyltransferase
MRNKKALGQDILVIRLGAVGDVVRTFPALALLKASMPEARLCYITEEDSFKLLEKSPILDEVLLFPRRRLSSLAKRPFGAVYTFLETLAFIKNLRKKRFEIVVDMHGILKSGLIARLSGAPLRVGFAKEFTRELNHLFLNLQVTPAPSSQTRVERNLDLALGLAPSSSPQFNRSAMPISLDLDASERNRLAPFLRGLAERKAARTPVILLNPFVSKRGRYKAWPLGYYAKLATMLHEDLGAYIGIVYGPGEAKGAVELERASRGSAVLAPQTSLKGLMALFSLAHVFVTADTGPMHLAGLTAVRIVALFGPSEPGLNAPMGKNSVVVYKKAPCAPCRNRGCIARVCMRSISPEEVFERIRALLQEDAVAK